jgi:hypothetical protein
VGRAPLLVAALAATLALAAPARAAAPRYILVSGPDLARPVLLDNWGENGALLAALVNARRPTGPVVRGLSRRPRLHLALFWGWPETPRPTRPRDANQHGWFYPARRGQPAVVTVLNGVWGPRIAPPRAVRILARHGIPTGV